LDGGSFDKCLDTGERAEAVNAIFAEGQAFGLPGTPAVFINGRLLSGTVDYDAMHKAIEEELRELAGR
jgi:protein-disulfide isomerase